MITIKLLYRKIFIPMESCGFDKPDSPQFDYTEELKSIHIREKPNNPG